MGYTIWPDGVGGDVLQEIHRERFRQEDLQPKGKFPWTCAAPSVSDEAKLAVLAEEFGEVAREVTEQLIDRGRRVRDEDEIEARALAASRRKIREELIRVAAVAAAWAESLTK
jgi:hypothetical protein